MSVPRRLVAALIAAMIALLSFAVAHAASIPLTALQVTAESLEHPCPGTATVTNGATNRTALVTVPPGCEGKALVLRLYQTGWWGNEYNVTGSATAATSGATAVTMSGQFDPQQTWSVRATVDGWNLPSTAWSYTPPPPPPYIWCTVIDASGATCTATVTIFTGVKPGGTLSATYYDVVVTTTSTSYVQWEVGFNLDHAYYTSRATRLGNSTLDGYNDGTTAWNGTTNGVTRQSACSELPLLLVRGDDTGGNNNFQNVWNNQARQFSLVVNRTDSGYHDVIEPYCH